MSLYISLGQVYQVNSS